MIESGSLSCKTGRRDKVQHSHHTYHSARWSFVSNIPLAHVKNATMVIGSVPVPSSTSVDEQLPTITIGISSRTPAKSFSINNNACRALKQRLLIERSSQASPSSVLPNVSCTNSSTGSVTNTDDTATINNTAQLPSASTNKPILKPFFIMDWLEEIDPKSMAIAQRMLRSQNDGTKCLLQRKKESSEIDKNNVEFVLTYGRESTTCSMAEGTDTKTIDEPLSTLNLSTYRANIDSEQHSIRNHFIPVSAMKSAVATSTVVPLPITSTSPFLQRSIRIGNQYHTRGIQQAKNGNWVKALQYWLNALEIRQQIYNDTAMTKHVDIANTYNNIGIAYGKLEQYDNAVRYLQMALEIRVDNYYYNNKSTTENEQQQLMDVATTLHNIGNIYQQQNQFSVAIQYYVQCKVLQEDMILDGINSNQIEIARTCIAIGHTYAMAQAYSDAYEAYYDAITIFHKAGITAPEDYISSNYSYEYAATLDDFQCMKEKMNSK
jgi:tetratricopeptide (TPR) repeat protein